MLAVAGRFTAPANASATSMTPRERVLATLNRQPVDRLPVDLWHTDEVSAALQQHLGLEDDLAVYRRLQLDKIVWAFLDYRHDQNPGATSPPGTDSTERQERKPWGALLRRVQAGAAHYEEVVSSPLAGCESVSDLDRYPDWPDVSRFDYEGAAALARKASVDFAVIGPWISCFEIYCQMRGLEKALLDLVDQPEFVDAALDRIEAIQTEMMSRYFAAAGKSLDLVFISDDIAGQKSLLLSPNSWRQHLQPRLKRWCDFIHAHDFKVFYHTDGAARPLIREILDCGVDVLNPIQHACPGMDLAGLKRDFGSHVIFHGGVDNQSVLPRGTPDDVRAEVCHCLNNLGADRQGYICSSCHQVQAGTPVANILAMIEEARQFSPS